MSLPSSSYELFKSLSHLYSTAANMQAKPTEIIKLKHNINRYSFAFSRSSLSLMKYFICVITKPP